MRYFMLFYIFIDVIRKERKEKPPRPGPAHPLSVPQPHKRSADDFKQMSLLLPQVSPPSSTPAS